MDFQESANQDGIKEAQEFLELSQVTVVLTSCGRPDLLLKTLRSFFKYNTYPIKKFIITEDSGLPAINAIVKKEFPTITYIDGSTRIGQIGSIDRAYREVESPFIFHLEEDWEFYRGGFIEESLDILQKEEKVSAVICRAHGDGGYWPDKNNPPFLTCSKVRWGYYSFNPGLRRLSDYKEHCNSSFSTFTTFVRHKAVRSEVEINNLFKEKGFRLAITKDPKGYVRHIGENRHVR